jgi:hypothetical protein
MGARNLAAAASPAAAGRSPRVAWRRRGGWDSSRYLAPQLPSPPSCKRSSVLGKRSFPPFLFIPRPTAFELLQSGLPLLMSLAWKINRYLRCLRCRACLKGWPVGSGALPGAHFCVWLPLPLPRPGLRGPNCPSPPGSRGTPFFTIALGLGLARHWAGDFRALCAGDGWPWRARSGEGKVPPALPRRENHGL